MALTRRKATPKVQPVEEIEPVVAVVCPPVEAVVSHARLLCSRCNNNEWSNGLCYEHFKNSQGLVYDEEQNRFIKHPSRSNNDHREAKEQQCKLEKVNRE